jgi:hypothetical protein
MLSVDEPPKIDWSGHSDGLHIAVLDRRILAVVYWDDEDSTWRWVAADRPYEHFLVEHGEKRDDPAIIFTATEILQAYLAGADPIKASERKWPP